MEAAGFIDLGITDTVMAGDIMAIGIPGRILRAELEARRKVWVKPDTKVKEGCMVRYAQAARSAKDGAVVLPDLKQG